LLISPIPKFLIFTYFFLIAFGAAAVRERREEYILAPSVLAIQTFTGESWGVGESYRPAS
jgi:hypothetical protein